MLFNSVGHDCVHYCTEMRDQTDRSVHLEHAEIVSLCCDITKGFVQRSAQVLCW